MPFCFVFLPLGIKADGGFCTLTLCAAGCIHRRLGEVRSELSCSFRSTLKNCLALLFSSSTVTAVSEERYGFTCNKQWKRKISFMEFIRSSLPMEKSSLFSSALTSIVKGGRKEIIPSATFFSRQFLPFSNHFCFDNPGQISFSYHTFTPYNFLGNMTILLFNSLNYFSLALTCIQSIQILEQ